MNRYRNIYDSNLTGNMYTYVFSACIGTKNHDEPNLHGGSGDSMGQIKSAMKIGKMIITKKATATLHRY